MLKRFGLIAAMMLIATTIGAGVMGQTTATMVTSGDANKKTTRLVVTGTATVQAQPDTANLTISVVTQSKRALDAQIENARKTDEVVKVVKTAVGAGGEVKTSGYNLTPQRIYKENQPPTITGYEARNSINVTISDLQRVGAVVDAASQAGANDISNLSFTLRRDGTARSQALSEATREAMEKARALAGVLQGNIVRIVEVQETNTPVRPLSYSAEYGATRTMAMAVPTPVEVGALDVNAQVQLVAEIEMKQ